MDRLHPEKFLSVLKEKRSSPDDLFSFDSLHKISIKYHFILHTGQMESA